MRWLPSPARVLVAVVGTYSLGLLITHPTLHTAMTYSLIADAPLPANITSVGGSNGSSGAVPEQGAGTTNHTRLRGQAESLGAVGGGSGGAKPKAHAIKGPIAAKEAVATEATTATKAAISTKGAIAPKEAVSTNGAMSNEPKPGIGEQEAMEGYRYFGIPPPARYAQRIEGKSRSGGCSAATPIDFTLVTQASLERLWMLPHICERWEGPVVVAVFQPPRPSLLDGEGEGEAKEVEERVLRQAHEGCSGRARLIVVRPPSGSKTDWASPDAFPVNSLRNLGVWEVDTSHFLLADVDLWPSQGLYSELKALALVKGARRRFMDPLSAFVVPAFQLQPPPDFFDLPPDLLSKENESDVSEALALRQRQLVSSMPTSSMQHLSSCLLRGRCIVFDSNYNPQGHATTESMQWITRQKRHSLRRLPCFLSTRYEPYLVLRRCDVTTPLFAEAFSGYGKNKIQHVQHLRQHDFSFYVLPPPLFLVHYPHANSAAKDSWLQLYPPPQEQEQDLQQQQQGNATDTAAATSAPAKSPHRQRMDYLYGQFQHWAAKHAEARHHTPTTPICQR